MPTLHLSYLVTFYILKTCVLPCCSTELTTTVSSDIWDPKLSYEVDETDQIWFPTESFRDDDAVDINDDADYAKFCNGDPIKQAIINHCIFIGINETLLGPMLNALNYDHESPFLTQLQSYVNNSHDKTVCRSNTRDYRFILCPPIGDKEVRNFCCGSPPEQYCCTPGDKPLLVFLNVLANIAVLIGVIFAFYVFAKLLEGDCKRVRNVCNRITTITRRQTAPTPSATNTANTNTRQRSTTPRNSIRPTTLARSTSRTTAGTQTTQGSTMVVNHLPPTYEDLSPIDVIVEDDKKDKETASSDFELPPPHYDTLNFRSYINEMTRDDFPQR